MQLITKFTDGSIHCSGIAETYDREAKSRAKVTDLETTMASFIDKAVDDAATTVFLLGMKVEYSILQEVIAGCLGYDSFGMLVADGDNTQHPLHLTDADALVMNVPMGAARAIQLTGQSEPLVTACIEAIERTCQTFAQFDLFPVPASSIEGRKKNAKAWWAGRIYKQGFNVGNTDRPTASLQVFCPDFVVSIKGGTTRRPRVAFIFDLKTKAVLANSVSVERDDTKLMLDVMEDAFGRFGPYGAAGKSEPHQSKGVILEVDHSANIKTLRKLGNQMNITVIAACPWLQGCAERLTSQISRSLNNHTFDDCDPVRPPSVFTFDEATDLVKRQIARYRNTTAARTPDTPL